MADAQVTLKLKDAASAGLKAIEKSAKGAASGFEAMAKQYPKLAKMNSLGVSLSKNLTAPILAAGAAFGALVLKTGAAADAIDKMSERTGISRTSLQELQYAASQTGVDFKALDGISAAFSGRLLEMQGGTSTAAKTFEALGLSTTDAAGNLKTSGQVFEETIAALAGIEDEAERGRAAIALLGPEGAKLAPLLNQGAAGIEELRARAHELGIVLDDETIASLVGMQDAVDDVMKAFAGLGNDLVTEFAPIIKETIVPLLKEQIVPALRDVAERIASVIRWFTDLDTEQKRVIGVLAGALVAGGPLLVGFARLIAAIHRAKDAFIALKTAGFAMSLTNPIGWVVLAIAGLTALAMFLGGRKKDEFGGAMDAAIDKISGSNTGSVVSAFDELIEKADGETRESLERLRDEVVDTSTTSAENLEGIAGSLDTLIDKSDGETKEALERLKAEIKEAGEDGETDVGKLVTAFQGVIDIADDDLQPALVEIQGTLVRTGDIGVEQAQRIADAFAAAFAQQALTENLRWFQSQTSGEQALQIISVASDVGYQTMFDEAIARGDMSAARDVVETATRAAEYLHSIGEISEGQLESHRREIAKLMPILDEAERRGVAAYSALVDPGYGTEPGQGDPVPRGGGSTTPPTTTTTDTEPEGTSYPTRVRSEWTEARAEYTDFLQEQIDGEAALNAERDAAIAQQSQAQDDLFAATNELSATELYNQRLIQEAQMETQRMLAETTPAERRHQDNVATYREYLRLQDEDAAAQQEAIDLLTTLSETEADLNAERDAHAASQITAEEELFAAVENIASKKEQLARDELERETAASDADIDNQAAALDELMAATSELTAAEQYQLEQRQRQQTATQESIRGQNELVDSTYDALESSRAYFDLMNGESPNLEAQISQNATEMGLFANAIFVAGEAHGYESAAVQTLLATYRELQVTQETLTTQAEEEIEAQKEAARVVDLVKSAYQSAQEVIADYGYEVEGLTSQQIDLINREAELQEALNLAKEVYGETSDEALALALAIELIKDSQKDLREELEADEAARAAEENLKKLEEAFQKLRSNITSGASVVADFLRNFDGMDDVADTVVFFGEQFSSLIQMVKDGKAAYEAYEAAILLANTNIQASQTAMKLATMDIIGLVIQAIAWLIQLFTFFSSKAKKAREEAARQEEEAAKEAERRAEEREKERIERIKRIADATAGAFSDGVRAYLTGSGNLDYLEEAFRKSAYDSILNGIIDALFQKAIIEGALSKTFEAIAKASEEGDWKRVNKLIEGLDKQVESVMNNINWDALDGLKSIFSDVLGEAVEDTLEEVEPEAWEAFAKSLKDAVNSGFGSALKEFVAGKATLEEFEESFKNNVYNAVLGGLIDAIMEAAIIEGALGSTLDAISKAFTTGDFDSANDLILGIGDEISDVVGSVAPIFATLRDTFSELLRDANAVNDNTKGLNVESASFGQFVSQVVAIPLYDASLRFESSVYNFGRYVDNLITEGIRVESNVRVGGDTGFVPAY